MKIFTPDMQAQGFLSHLINSKLVAYSKHAALAPAQILCVNLSESGRLALKDLFPHAKIKNLYFSELQQAENSIVDGTIDLLIANLTIASDAELVNLLKLAERVLKRDDLFVFAAWDRAGKDYLRKYAQRVVTRKLIDEIVVANELDDIENIQFVSYKEQILHNRNSDEFIACHIFVGRPNGSNELQYTPEIDEQAEEFSAEKINEEIEDITDVILQDDDAEEDEDSLEDNSFEEMQAQEEFVAKEQEATDQEEEIITADIEKEAVETLAAENITDLENGSIIEMEETKITDEDVESHVELTEIDEEEMSDTNVNVELEDENETDVETESEDDAENELEDDSEKEEDEELEDEDDFEEDLDDDEVDQDTDSDVEQGEDAEDDHDEEGDVETDIDETNDLTISDEESENEKESEKERWQETTSQVTEDDGITDDDVSEIDKVSNRRLLL